MNAAVSHHSRAVSDAAERQMRTWALQLQSLQRQAEERPVEPMPQLIRPYLAISRETGVDARELAEAVAAECGWKLLDRELLDFMAEHDHLSRLALDFVDERTSSWFHELFGKWLEQHLISQAEYVSRLGRIVLLAAQLESTIFIGRGVQFILPREAGLAVRIIAPRKQRILRVMERRHCTAREAEQYIDETDRNRAQFVERYFHHDVADPGLYDLVINLDRLTRDDAVQLIVSECKRHF